MERKSYDILDGALGFYENKGFKFIEVPWIVSKKAIDITRPNKKSYCESKFGYHVSSAEQSFLQLILDNKLNPGLYVACTPCYRDDEVDELHSKYFMKVELIDFLGYDHFEDADIQSRMDFVLNSAKEFFLRYLDIDIRATPDGIDIISNSKKIELGSYGIRSFGGFSWIYGTGVAEPRLSFCLNKNPGYHQTPIPHGKYGSFSKVVEEFKELEDSYIHSNPVMVLLEVADLIGALEGFVLKFSNESVFLNDLLKMKDSTKLAFESGVRSSEGFSLGEENE